MALRQKPDVVFGNQNPLNSITCQYGLHGVGCPRISRCIISADASLLPLIPRFVSDPDISSIVFDAPHSIRRQSVFCRITPLHLGIFVKERDAFIHYEPKRAIGDCELSYTSAPVLAFASFNFFKPPFIIAFDRIFVPIMRILESDSHPPIAFGVVFIDFSPARASYPNRASHLFASQSCITTGNQKSDAVIYQPLGSGIMPPCILFFVIPQYAIIRGKPDVI